MKRSSRALLALSFLAASGSTAVAQPGASPSAGPVPPPPSVSRRGLIIGGGLGIGPKGFRGNDDFYAERALVYQLEVGGMLTPRLALGGEFFGWSHKEEFDDGASTDYEQHLGVWLRYWVLPRLWLQGGLDGAREGVHLPSDRPTYDPHKGIGVSGAAGFELLHRSQASIDLTLRVAAARYAERDAFQAESDPASASAALAVTVHFWF